MRTRRSRMKKRKDIYGERYTEEGERTNFQFIFLREKLKYRKIFPFDRKGKNIYNSGKLRVTLASKLRAKS